MGAFGRFAGTCRRGIARGFEAVATQARNGWVAFGSQWNHSLQLRVVVSTLALSSSVVFVLGVVLQTQMTERLITAKVDTAKQQTLSAATAVEADLAGADPGGQGLEAQFRTALGALGNRIPTDGSGNRSGGDYFAVLIDGQGSSDPANGVAFPSTLKNAVDEELRKRVEAGRIAWKIDTRTIERHEQTVMVWGTPVSTSGRQVQLYLMFPLTIEQNTLGVVQSTLVVCGIVLLLLLAGITNLVIRQVVRPVRQAAAVAVRFADGQLDERMSVVGEDDVARLAESFNDMAESIQKQIVQLEEFGQLQRRFTSDVSHELKTPLTTVRMAADVLHGFREDLPSQLGRATELMVDELDRFEDLLNDLLEISRLDAGVADLAAEPMDVSAVARRAVDSVRAIAAGAGVEVRTVLPDEPVIVDLDSRRIERVLRNLLANAVDHAEGKPVTLWLAADADAVAITVRDRGVGLRLGEDELVFNRFWRADPSRNRRTGGTGLGLAISLEDTRLHGGWLQAWGRPGLGACFRLTLPRTQDIELRDSPLPLPPPEPAPPVPINELSIEATGEFRVFPIVNARPTDSPVPAAEASEGMVKPAGSEEEPEDIPATTPIRSVSPVSRRDGGTPGSSNSASEDGRSPETSQPDDSARPAPGVPSVGGGML